MYKQLPLRLQAATVSLTDNRVPYSRKLTVTYTKTKTAVLKINMNRVKSSEH